MASASGKDRLGRVSSGQDIKNWEYDHMRDPFGPGCHLDSSQRPLVDGIAASYVS